MSEPTVLPVQVNVEKIKAPNGALVVRLSVTSGLLQMAFTLDPPGAKGIADALIKQAASCESGIILAPGPLPGTAGN